MWMLDNAFGQPRGSPARSTAAPQRGLASNRPARSSRSRFSSCTVVGAARGFAISMQRDVPTLCRMGNRDGAMLDVMPRDWIVLPKSTRDDWKNSLPIQLDQNQFPRRRHVGLVGRGPDKCQFLELQPDPKRFRWFFRDDDRRLAAAAAMGGPCHFQDGITASRSSATSYSRLN